jgi:hypothetical protein
MMSGIVNVSDCAFPLAYFLLYRLPAHSKCQRMTPRPLWANGTEDQRRLPREVSERALEPISGLGFHRGAGDGNRTRTISLGICAILASTRPDLRCGVSVSDRERPLVTGV